jgi:hypothetical protein
MRIFNVLFVLFLSGAIALLWWLAISDVIPALKASPFVGAIDSVEGPVLVCLLATVFGLACIKKVLD